MAFFSSISISMTSFSVVSLMAMVPDRECRMPTFTGPADWAIAGVLSPFTVLTAATVAAAAPDGRGRDGKD